MGQNLDADVLPLFHLLRLNSIAAVHLLVASGLLFPAPCPSPPPFAPAPVGGVDGPAALQTAGYIILDKDEPTKIIQRGSGQFMVPTFEYETLCDGDEGCKYGGERRNVIFLCSATKIGPDKFRLFFGGGDGNVGTGVVQVAEL